MGSVPYTLARSRCSVFPTVTTNIRNKDLQCNKGASLSRECTSGWSTFIMARHYAKRTKRTLALNMSLLTCHAMTLWVVYGMSQEQSRTPSASRFLLRYAAKDPTFELKVHHGALKCTITACRGLSFLNLWRRRMWSFSIRR